MTTTGRRTCRLAMLSGLAAPVSCSAIRKSDAWRTPRARPFFIGTMVGRPAPAQSAMWSKPSAKALVDGERAAEAHAAEHRELRAALEQQADDLEEVLVPAHGDAVFGDAAEAGHDAVVEPLVELRRRRGSGRNGTRSPRASTPEISGGSGSIFSPSIADDGVAVVHQVMREREARRAEADDQHLVAASAAWAAAGADRAGSSASAARRSRSPRAAPARP